MVNNAKYRGFLWCQLYNAISLTNHRWQGEKIAWCTLHEMKWHDQYTGMSFLYWAQINQAEVMNGKGESTLHTGMPQWVHASLRTWAHNWLIATLIRWCYNDRAMLYMPSKWWTSRSVAAKMMWQWNWQILFPLYWWLWAHFTDVFFAHNSNSM